MPLEFVVDTMVYDATMEGLREPSATDASRYYLKAIAIAIGELVKEVRDIRGQLEELNEIVADKQTETSK